MPGIFVDRLFLGCEAAYDIFYITITIPISPNQSKNCRHLCIVNDIVLEMYQMQKQLLQTAAIGSLMAIWLSVLYLAAVSM